jgi:hypothetical protein
VDEVSHFLADIYTSMSLITDFEQALRAGAKNGQSRDYDLKTKNKSEEKVSKR